MIYSNCYDFIIFLRKLCIRQNVKHVLFSGEADDIIVESSDVSQETNRHKFEWSTKSRSSVKRFNVSFQQESETIWKSQEVEADAYKSHLEDHYRGSVHLSDLQPNTKYRVKVASENSFGYNIPKTLHHFFTKGPEPINMKSILASRSNSYILSSCLFVLTLVTYISTIY